MCENEWLSKPCHRRFLLGFFFFFFFLAGWGDSTGVWTQGFMLATWMLYRLNHTSSPLWFWLLWEWGLAFCPGLLRLCSSYCVLPPAAGVNRCTSLCPAFFFVEMESYKFDSLINWLAQAGLTPILLISAFQVASIIGLRHWCPDSLVTLMAIDDYCLDSLLHKRLAQWCYSNSFFTY
jgi:hypothetical protein